MHSFMDAADVAPAWEAMQATDGSVTIRGSPRPSSAWPRARTRWPTPRPANSCRPACSTASWTRRERRAAGAAAADPGQPPAGRGGRCGCLTPGPAGCCRRRLDAVGAPPGRRRCPRPRADRRRVGRRGRRLPGGRRRTRGCGRWRCGWPTGSWTAWMGRSRAGAAPPTSAGSSTSSPTSASTPGSSSRSRSREPAARLACLALLMAYYVSGTAFLALSSLLERRGSRADRRRRAVAAVRRRPGRRHRNHRRLRAALPAAGPGRTDRVAVHRRRRDHRRPARRPRRPRPAPPRRAPPRPTDCR